MSIQRDSGPKLPIENVNMILNNGGAGDIISCFPVIQYTLSHQENVIPHVFVPNYMKPLTKVFFPNTNVYGFSEAKVKLKETGNYAAMQTLGDKITNMRVHSTDYAFQTLLDKQVRDEFKSYPKYPVGTVSISKFDLPEKYAVVNIGHTIKAKEWPAAETNKVIDFLISKGVTPVFLGKNDIQDHGSAKIKDDPLMHANFAVGVNLKKGVNLLNKTSLIETMEILAKAQVFVGIDGGLLHMAACTDIPIVVGFTFVEPMHILPYRDGVMGKGMSVVEPDESLKCRGCQSKWAHLYNVDFRSCWYDDYECTKQMTGEKFIDKLRTLV